MDMCGMNEVGIKWSDMEAGSKWRDRSRGQFQNERTVLAWNKEDPLHKKSQWGGTGMVTIGRLTAKIKDTKSDEANLGRWAWTTLRGAQWDTVVLTVYQPVRNHRGAASVYQQQKAVLLDQNDTTDPIEKLRNDLEAAIVGWKDAGTKIIIMGDINKPTNEGETAAMFHRQGLRNIMEGLQGFSTYVRNTQNKIIDGMWTSPSLVPTNAGYTEFGEWDHRTVWADFNTEELLGNRKTPELHVDARRLRIRDGDAVERYLQHYRKAAANSRLAERARELDQSIDRKMTVEQTEILEQLDQERTSMMLKAERQCRKLRTGTVPFSPEAMEKAWALAFWKLALKRRKGGTVNSRLWQRRKRKARITTATRNLTTEDIETKVQDAKEKWDSEKASAARKRQTFLERQAERYAETHQTDKAKAVQILIKREEQKDMWKKIRGALRGGSRTGITHVVGTDSAGHRTTYETEKDIVQCCIQENKKKYRQTNATPFMQGRLRRTVGNVALTTGAAQILEGTYNNETQPQYTKAFISALRKPETARQWTRDDLEISLSEHQQAWRKAKESTSSSPSGLHFGLWKANATDDTLADIDRILRGIPFRTGHSLRRWQTGVDVELCKKAGNYDVDKLRTIVLLEADYNMNNKAMSRRVARAAERDGTLAKEQYGSRNRHSAPDVSLNNRLTDDLMRQTRKGGAVISNDAKSCYDRIVHAVLSLCLQRMGVAVEPIQSLIDTMRHLTHHVKTAYGVSAESYAADEKSVPLQGIVQGNAMGPMGWGAVSTPIIGMMRAGGFGFQHWNSVTKEAIEFACFAYVDDTDLVHSRQDGLPDRCFLDEVQEAVNRWEGGLHSTGGALVPAKSYWYWIDFKWDGAKWQYKTARDMPGEITMKDLTGQPVTLQRLEATESRRALGVMVRRDGSDADNLRAIKRKGEEWADKVRTSKLTRMETWLATKATIWKTIEFPLRSMCATRQEIVTATKPALQTALQRTGIQRCFPRALVFGDSGSLGLGLHHPHITQTWQHVRAVLQHGHQNTTTGELLRASFEELRTELGIMGNPLEKDFKKWSHLATSCWWKHTWRDTGLYDITLHTPEGPSRERPWRERDRTIMETLVDGGVAPADLRRANRCRMYLEVIWVSEVADAAGNRIAETVWNGEKDPHTTRPTGMWPKTATPTSVEWRSWQKALAEVLLEPGTASRRLRRPLGKFYSDGEHVRSWKWWRTAQNDLVEKTDSGWIRWGTERRGRYRQRGTVGDKPDKFARRVTTHLTALTTRKIMSTDTRASFEPEEAETELERYERNWSTGNAIIKWQDLAGALVNETAVAVSDGSWKNGFGAAAFRVGDATTEKWQSVGDGDSWINGGVTASGSHRAELAGLHGIVATVTTAARMENLQGGGITVGCDNQSALRSLRKDWHFDAGEADYDLIQSIQYMVKNTTIAIRGKHVKGHQDTCGKPLDNWAKWNVAMDTKAKRAWREYQVHHRQRRQQAVGGPAWTVSLRKQQVQKADATEMYNATAQHETREAWRKHLGMPRKWDSVDWDAIDKAARYVGEGRKIWAIKHLSNNSGTAATLVKWKYRECEKCPRCGARQEDSDHVNECKGAGTDEIWQRYVEQVNLIGDKHRLDPDMMGTIVAHLEAWRRNRPPPTPVSHRRLRQAVTVQKQLGWSLFVKGFIGHEWRSVQSDYELAEGRAYKTKQWMGRLAAAGWEYMYQMWQHRNEATHALDGQLATSMRDRLRQAIHHEKVSGDTALAEGMRGVWAEPENSILQKPVEYQQQWLRVIRAARRVGEPVDYRAESAGLNNWMATGRL